MDHSDEAVVKAEYNRVLQWEKFSGRVRKHIVEYTLPQYGNPAGNEQIDSFTIEDCWKNVERYINRRKTNVRGFDESLRDLLKIAHYMNFIYDKMKAEQCLEDIY